MLDMMIVSKSKLYDFRIIVSFTVLPMLMIYFDSNILRFIGGEINIRFSFIQYKILFVIFSSVFIVGDIYLLKFIKNTEHISAQIRKDKKNAKLNSFSKLFWGSDNTQFSIIRLSYICYLM